MRLAYKVARYCDLLSSLYHTQEMQACIPHLSRVRYLLQEEKRCKNQ
jgi:hypothetical protein